MSVSPVVEFHTRYELVRKQFIEAAERAGGAIESHQHPEAFGHEGEPLYMDVVRFGASDSSRLLVMLAGTHGSEGLAISPLFCAAMNQGHFSRLPADTAVLLIHGVNPYGLAHLSRTNENHVDLNRNFIDFAQPLPANPGYEELHADLCVLPGSPEAVEAAKRIQRWRGQQGQNAFMAAIFNGQYRHADGLLYGGQERQWSNRTLEQVVRQHARGACRVAFIDWHTGLGEWGKPFFLCFNAAGSDEREQCRRWWGAHRVDHQAGFDGGSRPEYVGLVFDGVQGFVAPAAFAGAVIEFGTTPPDATIAGLQLDRYLHLFGHTLEAGERAELQRRALESFCPSDAEWRAGVLQAGQEIIEQTLRGLEQWGAGAAR